MIVVTFQKYHGWYDTQSIVALLKINLHHKIYSIKIKIVTNNQYAMKTFFCDIKKYHKWYDDQLIMTLLKFNLWHIF